ncbi:MAG: 2-oxo-4-hydroxy-4-carboxy-5-ureidoimidazoline decarboxylase [Steroidobacteraceae bacterium]
MTTERLSIEQMNSMDRATFVARFGGVYERSPWVAEEAWHGRPFADLSALERAMQAVVLGAGHTRQLELLRMHPPLGTRLKLSGFSRAEQAGAGLLEAAEAERHELETLNHAYERRFGFPFIVAVRHASLRSILEGCRTRMNHDVESEFDESLRQVFRIAGFRLADLLAGGL